MFDQRSNGFEYIDQGQAPDELIRKSHWFMQWMNIFFGGRAIVKKFIETEYRRLPKRQPLTILDIGSGSCDIPLSLLDWAARKGLDLRFTCVERSSEALAMARQQISASDIKGIELIETDIWDYQPAAQFDCAVGSLFFHHFTDEQILELINRLRPFVRRSILINDLQRSPLPYLGCAIFRPILPWQAWHDAMLSIKRGFKPDELQRLLEKIDNAHIKTNRRWFARVSAEIRFD